MIFCKYLNREFATKDEHFAALKAENARIVGLKKAAIKFSESIPNRLLCAKSETAKAFDWIESGHIYPVINTCLYMDSHDDVHLPGIWTKSLKEQQGKVYYLINHKMEIGSVIAYPADIELMVKSLSWSELGRSEYLGETEALIFKTKISDYSNSHAKAVIENKLPAENSVRMQYVKIQFCVNSESEYYKEEKAAYDKYINQIVNRDVVEAQGYFYAVSEAKIFREGSMVLSGSNDVTPILYNESPSTPEPSKDTKEKSVSIEQIQSIINGLTL